MKATATDVRPTESRSADRPGGLRRPPERPLERVLVTVTWLVALLVSVAWVLGLVTLTSWAL